jgi:hypothetical protein
MNELLKKTNNPPTTDKKTDEVIGEESKPADDETEKVRFHLYTLENIIIHVIGIRQKEQIAGNERR